MNTAHQESGYDVVVINYRGLAGIELATSKVYCSYAYMDIVEPMEYVYNKYCLNPKKKAYAIGCSMGANILANLLGHLGQNCILDAACVVQAPIKKWEV